MDLVLQAQGQSCQIAPGADLNVATSLLQMSVLGLPLILALFQFITDHEYEDPEDEISKRTFVYGFVMVASTIMLWAFYYTAFCVIRSKLGANSLTNLLFLFMLVLLAIIIIIWFIQSEQMVVKELQYSLRAYLLSFGFLVSVVLPSSVIWRVIAIVLAGMCMFLGLIHRHIGFEQAGERTAARWIEWKSAREKKSNSDDE